MDADAAQEHAGTYGDPEEVIVMDMAMLHRRAVGVWTARVDAVGPDQWELPTPCEDWTVRDLVNHVVGEDRWTVPLMRGRTIEQLGDALDGDLLGTAPAAAAQEAAAEAVTTVAELLPTEGKVHLSYGEESMVEYVAQLAADHLVHAWDLAAATGSDTRLEGVLVEAVASWFAGRETRYRSGGFIGPRADVPSEDPQSRLLAGFGRSATWTPR